MSPKNTVEGNVWSGVVDDVEDALEETIMNKKIKRKIEALCNANVLPGQYPRQEQLVVRENS